MTDDRLRALVAELDAIVPRDGALVRDGAGFRSDADEPAYTANRLGYRRLGIELLKIADAAPLPDRPDRIAADLEYLIDPMDVPGKPTTFERREQLRPWNVEEGLRDKGLLERFAPALWLVLLALLVVPFVLGLRDILTWWRGL